MRCPRCKTADIMHNPRKGVDECPWCGYQPGRDDPHYAHQAPPDTPQRRPANPPPSREEQQDAFVKELVEQATCPMCGGEVEYDKQRQAMACIYCGYQPPA
jgi:DNA-directed RNA polymerase subunit M/transcription elongation factor TFIIS